MKIAYEHLLRKIKAKPSINELSEKLFHLGHEHEIQGSIFNMELTPNRGDCLSLNGILRDLALFYEVNLHDKFYEEELKNQNFGIKFCNNATDACPKIAFLKIDIESIPSKYVDYLENFFIDLEVKKNNFFADISNYLSYEIGQPTHCYQSDKLQSELRLDFCSTKQKFKTLLEKTIEVDEGDLVFYNSKEEIINLAGVMGGLDTSCVKNTKSVIVECAYFDPEAIMGTAIKYSINSEAAHKFERNVDPLCHEYTLRRFIKIVEDHTTINDIQFFSQEYAPIQEKVINLDIKKINAILGTSISEQRCIEYLHSLGFIVSEMSIKVPSHRHDISSMHDISEEIARSVGYNNIKPKNFIISPSKKSQIYNKNEIKIKNLLIHNGFCEVINDSFTNEKNINTIEVDNPLDANRKYLRTKLKKSLLDNLLYNERRQQESIKLFEISDLYDKKSQTPKRVLGLIVSGRVDNNYKDFNRKLDKKYLDSFLSKYIDAPHNINCEIIPRHDIKSKSKNTIAYHEIELNESLKVSYVDDSFISNNLNIKYTPISEYPSSTRDLSFSITDYSKCVPLQEYILEIQDKLLKEVFIFDYYVNEKRAEIKIGFRFIFQSNKSTITEKEVNFFIDRIIDYSNSIEGVTIPGLD